MDIIDPAELTANHELRHLKDVDPDIEALHSPALAHGFYLVRERDGVPLAKGYSRAMLGPMRAVFEKLGVKCRIVNRNNGFYWAEGMTIEAFREGLRALYRKRQHAALLHGDG